MIATIIKEFLDYAGFTDAEVVERNLGDRIKVDIQSQNGRDLIGEKGEALSSLQHVIRRIVVKRLGGAVALDIDINGYKKMRESILSDFAKDMRERVRLCGRAIELDPMPSFDRRIIHLTLANFSDVSTESVGEGRDRFIVVHPRP